MTIHVNKNKGRFIFIIIFLLQYFVSVANTDNTLYNYGLSFSSHSVNQDERTSLELTPDKSFRFSDNGFEINFDLKLREELYTYGYVARIVSNDVSSFDIVSYLFKGKLNFILTNRDNIIQNIGIEDPHVITKDEWMNVRLQFNRNDIQVTVGDEVLTMNHSFKDFQDIKIYFGRNKHANFYTTDVPPMTIRNIVIKRDNGELFREWELMGHNNNDVFDKTQHDRAIVENGIWEIDKHRRWSKVKSFIVPDKNPQITFDHNSGRVFIIYDRQLAIYNVRNNTADSVFADRGNPYVGVSSQIVYIPESNRILSYNSDSQKLNFYNFEEKSWEEDDKIFIGSKQHHNRVVDSENNQLILFGGYGEHRYNSQLCKIDLDKGGEWQVTSLDTIIYPRYLSAMGWEDKENLLIIGGHGSRSGKQEESPRNFYDLYRVNVKSGECVKVWEIDQPEDHFVFGNSMVVDKAENSIYALTYDNRRFNTYLYLSRFDIETGDPVQYIMSDSIEYNFLDIRSYCDLFYDKETSSLYAVVQQQKDDLISTVDIYKLIFPPFYQEGMTFLHSGKGTYWWSKYNYIIILLVLLLVSVAVANIWQRRRKKLQRSALQPLDYTGTDTLQPVEIARPKRISTISLLGGFQVFDKDGNDMTSDFTPTIKQLFLYIFLYSIKYGKGVTSQRLDETFWFDMEKSNAANNRNVNIRRLRLVLEKIRQISLSNKGGNWFIEIGKDANCDYKEVKQMLLYLKSHKGDLNKYNITKIIDFAASGTLLPSIEAEWVDEYKAEYSALITEIMLRAIKSTEIKEDLPLLLKITDVILINDTIDEDAIRIKCRILFQSGQKGLSKQCFDKFSADYRRLLNTEPDLKYEDIIS